MTDQQTDLAEEMFVDPMAPAHKRIVEQQISDTSFEFIWTRALVADLLEVLGGKRQGADESLKEAMSRMLVKAVESSQKGLLLDILKSRSNFTMTEKLVSGMLPLITANETKIGKPKCISEGDTRSVTIPLATDGTVQSFTFTSDRNRYDDFQNTKHTEDDMAVAINGFLLECLEEEKKRRAFARLEFDERNFTLSVKVFGKVSHFLARNQDIIAAPTLKKSAK